MPDNLILTRDQLAKFLPNHEAIKAFESLFDMVSTIIPDEIINLFILAEAAAINAGNADASANSALAQLIAIRNNLDLLVSAPLFQQNQKEDLILLPPIPQAVLDENLGPVSQPPIISIPTSVLKTGDAGGNYSLDTGVVGTGYQDVDTDLGYSVFIPVGWNLQIGLVWGIQNSANAAAMFIAIYDSVGAAVAAELNNDNVSAGYNFIQTLLHVITGDDAVHAIKPQWKASAGTSTMINSSSTNRPRMSFLLTPTTL